MSKPKMSKAEWIQYNREAKERNEFILNSGKREAVEAKIKKATDTTTNLFLRNLQIETERSENIILIQNLKKEYEEGMLNLHILTVGPYAWRKCQEAIAQMEERRD